MSKKSLNGATTYPAVVPVTVYEVSCGGLRHIDIWGRGKTANDWHDALCGASANTYAEEQPEDPLCEVCVERLERLESDWQSCLVAAALLRDVKIDAHAQWPPRLVILGGDAVRELSRRVVSTTLTKE